MNLQLPKFYFNRCDDFGVQDIVNSNKWKFGQSVFTSFIVRGGEVIGVDLHQERLQFGLKNILNKEHDVLGCFEFLRSHKLEDCYLRIEYFLDSNQKPQQKLIEFIEIKQLPHITPAVALSNKIIKRTFHETDLCKTSDYLKTLFEKQGEECLVEVSGKIVEATTSAVLFVKNDLFVFPKNNGLCLSSVTANCLQQKFDELVIEYKIDDILEEDLVNMEEVYLLNAVSGIRFCKSMGSRKLQNKKYEFLKTTYEKCFVEFRKA